MCHELYSALAHPGGFVGVSGHPIQKRHVLEVGYLILSFGDMSKSGRTRKNGKGLHGIKHPMNEIPEIFSEKEAHVQQQASCQACTQ